MWSKIKYFNKFLAAYTLFIAVVPFMTTDIELDSMEEITADSIHNWIELLSHCLIQPRLPSCEKLFIMVKDVFCAALEKRVIWDKDLMTSFMRINIIQHCSELQRDVYFEKVDF